MKDASGADIVPEEAYPEGVRLRALMRTLELDPETIARLLDQPRVQVEQWLEDVPMPEPVRLDLLYLDEIGTRAQLRFGPDAANYLHTPQLTLAGRTPLELLIEGKFEAVYDDCGDAALATV